MKPCHLLSFETLVTAAERGPLAPADARHLRRCAGCRQAVALLADQAEALRRLTAPRGGHGLRERILQRAREEGRRRLVEALRALLRLASRRPGRGSCEDPGGAAPAETPAMADLLFEVAVLDRRLGRLGGSPGLDGLAGLPPTAPDLARRARDVLGRFETAWPADAGPPCHQPTATPSLRDSLAPR